MLGFTYAQNHNLGVGFIAYAGGLELKYRVVKSAPIMKAVHEGYRIGKAAKNIVQEDIAALLREPLVDARKRLGYCRTSDIQSGARSYAVRRYRSL